MQSYLYLNLYLICFYVGNLTPGVARVRAVAAFHVSLVIGAEVRNVSSSSAAILKILQQRDLLSFVLRN